MYPGFSKGDFGLCVGQGFGLHHFDARSINICWSVCFRVTNFWNCARFLLVASRRGAGGFVNQEIFWVSPHRVLGRCNPFPGPVCAQLGYLVVGNCK